MSKKGLLLWEPSWDTFRPVKSVVWNPVHKQIEPYFGEYIHDIFDIHYGYGDETLHTFCIEFTDEHVHDISSAEPISLDDFWRWTHTTLVWIHDRAIAIHPCSNNIVDTSVLLERLHMRAKTYKRCPRNIRGTRKNIHQ